MKISPDEIAHVATLARLRLDGEEQERLASDLGTILEYVDKLAELDTDQVEPTAQIVEGARQWRDDEVAPWKEPESLLENAPDRAGNQFKVPRIIE